jgi:hypothetical protein
MARRPLEVPEEGIEEWLASFVKEVQ